MYPEDLAAIAYDVLENLLEGCQVINFELRYLYINTAGAIQGKSSPGALIGKTMQECYPGIENSAMFAELTRCLFERRYGHMENLFHFPDGRSGTFELRFIPVPEGLCILSADITEKKLLEQRLLQSQKLEALGALVSGVAHDFNNLLTPILGYSSVLLENTPESDPAHEDLQEIWRAGSRAAELTQQLLAFGRKQQMAPVLLDMNESLTRVSKMLQRVLGANITLELELCSSLGRVWMDPGRLEQVILNLVVNARDALPQGGQVTIETANIELDEDYAAGSPGVSAGPHAMLAISDTGQGIDEDTRAKIFEPFFTTKEQGKGTGLGLAVVQGIVQQSGGHIWVYSEPGRGTTFKIYLPHAVSGAAVEQARLPSSPRHQLRGTETILLAEDDESVRKLVSSLLVRNGYQVVAARDGEEAVALGEDHQGDIHLLVADLSMPRMGGVALAAQLRTQRRGLKVLYLSGYTDGAVLPGLASGEFFLQKPVIPSTLLRTIRAIFAESTPRG